MLSWLCMFVVLLWIKVSGVLMFEVFLGVDIWSFVGWVFYSLVAVADCES